MTVPDRTTLSESAVQWVGARIPLSTVFVYLDVSGEFIVDALRPIRRAAASSATATRTVLDGFDVAGYASKFQVRDLVTRFGMPVRQRYYTYQDQTFLTVTTPTGDVEPEVEESDLIGEMKIWPCTLAPGYLMCFGQELPRTDRLFQVLGTRFGDGATTFNLPDCRGRFMVGQQLGGLPPIILGDTGGERTTELLLPHVPAHAHPGRAHRHGMSQHSHGQRSHAHALNAHSHVITLHRHGTPQHPHAMSHSHKTGIQGSKRLYTSGALSRTDETTTRTSARPAR